MNKKILLIAFIALLVLILAFFLIKSRQTKINRPGLSFQTSSSWQNLRENELPASFEIKNFKFIGGEKDCCVCSGLTSLYKFNGGSEKIFDILSPMALNHDLTYITKALKQYHLQDRIHLSYFYQGMDKEKRQQLLKDFSENLTNPQNQIIIFKNSDEAFITLKKLLSKNIPVMFAWEDSEKIGNSQEECQDDTYNVAVGYDQNKITFYTLPGIKSSASISEFKKKWELQNKEFCYWIFPGNYSLIWLEKD